MTASLSSFDEFKIAARFARRELRAGLKGFRIFLACLMLGVAAIAGVGSVSSALVEGLSQEGQTILGGDVSLRLIHREAREDELAYLRASGEVSQVIEMRAMSHAPKTDERSLVELKSVDDLYPLYGTLSLSNGARLQDALTKKEGVWGSVVEQTLLDRLGVGLGDTVKVGDLETQIRAIIEREPDKLSGGMAFGPRLFVSGEAVRASGLIRPGSLAQFHYRVKLPEAQRSNAAVAAFVDETESRFPQAGWRIQDRSDSAPSVRRFVKRVALFLTLVGLTALIVGGVGVGNAVTSYLDSKREVIATFKCLGAPGRLVFRLYLLQVVALSLIGIVLGLGLGAAVPFIVQSAAGDLIPVPARFAIYSEPLMLAAAYGFLTALAFAIWPLARAREIPATGLFRDIVAPVRRWPRPPYVVATGGALLLLAALAIGLTDERLFAAWFVAGAGLSFIVLRFTGQGLMWLARKAPRVRQPQLRLAIANLHRPGAATPSVVLSLGLGLTLLVTVSLIDGNIEAQVQGELPDRAPSFFFVDIGPEQVEEFERIVNETPGVEAMNRVPMLRGRITEIAGTRSEGMEVPPNVAWALQGDRGITYAEELPDNSTLVRGEWWGPGYDGPPLVSLSEELAAGFGMEVGDMLTVNVLGRPLSARLANTREIDWQSVGINFVLVFSPGALAGAPHTHLATVTMEAENELQLQRDVSRAFPNVTSVRVKEALETINAMIENFAVAVRATSIVTLSAGVLVLAGAMAAGHRRRVYDAVILKVLGATRGRVLGAYAMEYLALGLGTAVIASGAGALAAWLVITQVMEAPWTFLPWTLAATVLGGAAATLGLGLLGTYSALSAKAAPVLRAE